jgi:hypothetical protein
MRLRALLVALFAAPLLSACVDDRASWQIDGTREHTLTLVREQPVFWDKKVNLYLVVSRMPACTRRHSLGVGTDKTRVTIYQVPSGAFIVQVGKRMYATESQTCESWARLEEEPADGLGEMRGAFRVRNGELAFVAEKPGAAGDEEE